MKAFFKFVLLMTLSISSAYAKNFVATDISVTSIRLKADFFQNEDKAIDLNVISNENITADYVSNITSTFIGAAGEQILYTAESNQNPHGTSMPAGMLPGGPVPSATVNMKRKTITIDMTSLFTAHGPMDQSLGGIATGTYNPWSGEYTVSWTTTLTQGGNAGKDVTVIMSGNVQLKPRAFFKHKNKHKVK